MKQKLKLKSQIKWKRKTFKIIRSQINKTSKVCRAGFGKAHETSSQFSVALILFDSNLRLNS